MSIISLDQALSEKEKTETKTEQNKTVNTLHLLDKVIAKYSKKIPEEISLALKEILEQELKDIDFESDMDEKNSIKTVVHDYMKMVGPRLTNVSERIAEILKTKISKDFEQMKIKAKENNKE